MSYSQSEKTLERSSAEITAMHAGLSSFNERSYRDCGQLQGWKANVKKSEDKMNDGFKTAESQRKKDNENLEENEEEF